MDSLQTLVRHNQVRVASSFTGLTFGSNRHKKDRLQLVVLRTRRKWIPLGETKYTQVSGGSGEEG